MTLNDRAFPHTKSTTVIEVRTDLARGRRVRDVRLFGALFSARRFIDILTDGVPYRQSTTETIVLDDGSSIWSRDMTAILAYKLTKEEQAWVIPRPYRSEFERLRPNTDIGN